MKKLVLESLEEVLDRPVDESEVIFGPGGILDSLDLVRFIIDLELRIFETYDLNVSVASDKAMSYRNSPFRSVDSLSKFVKELISENDSNNGD